MYSWCVSPLRHELLPVFPQVKDLRRVWDTSAERADVSSLSASSRFVNFAKLRRASADVRLMTDVVNVVRSLPEGGDTDER